MTTNLKALCGFIKPDTRPCKNTAIDGSGRCYSHSPLRAEERRKNSSKGGRIAGRGRPSISKELGELRQLVGVVVELHAKDNLSAHLNYHLRDFIKMLELYLTFTKLEIKTKRADEVATTHTLTRRTLIDPAMLREDLENLVINAGDEDIDYDVVGHDPTKGGAA